MPPSQIEQAHLADLEVTARRLNVDPVLVGEFLDGHRQAWQYDGDDAAHLADARAATVLTATILAIAKTHTRCPTPQCPTCAALHRAIAYALAVARHRAERDTGSRP